MKNKKSLKPTEIEVHIKYECPKCESKHWLSLREAQTPGFIIVCECNEVYRVKTVDKVMLKYKKKANTKITTPIIQTKQEDVIVPEKVEEQAIIEKPIIPEEILKKCVNILEQYGFTHSESVDLIKDSYANEPSESVVNIIKNCLSKQLGENTNEPVDSSFSL